MVSRKQRKPSTPAASRDLETLDKVGLLEEAERRNNETAALLESARVGASSLDLGHVLGAILDQLGSIIEHTGASILLFRDDSVEFVEARSVTGTMARSGARIPLDVAPELLAAMRRGDTVIIDDVRSDEPFAADYRASIDAVGVRDLPPFNVIRSWMAVPLAIKDRVIGMLTISWTEQAFFTVDHSRLARAFADQAVVALENARLYEETRSSARRFEALSRADNQLFATLDLDKVLQALVDVTVDVMGVHKSMVSTWNSAMQVMTLRAWRNLGDNTLTYIRELFNRRTQRMEARNPDERYDDSLLGVIVTEDASRAPPHLVPIIEAEGIRAMIEIPVVSAAGQPLGFFSVAYTTEHHFDMPEQRLLSALAERAAVAISNAELHERAQRVASLEERQRLSRELHDSVSQALYGIALGARTARAQLERDPEKAAEPIDYVLSLAEAGMAEMRALIFELRPESLEKEGLVAAIKKQADAAAARHDLRFELDLCEEPDLAIEAKEALYRICQEAMNNVVKHAQASKIDVQLVQTKGQVTLTVTDDGVGFDTEGDFPGHLGLHSMRERAERVGGQASIQALPGEGAQVIVWVPA